MPDVLGACVLFSDPSTLRVRDNSSRWNFKASCRRRQQTNKGLRRCWKGIFSLLPTVQHTTHAESLGARRSSAQRRLTIIIVEVHGNYFSPLDCHHRNWSIRFVGFAPFADDISEDSARVFAAGANRWLVRDTRLAQMSLNTDWEYYGAVDRFLKVTADNAPAMTWSI